MVVWDRYCRAARVGFTLAEFEFFLFRNSSIKMLNHTQRMFCVDAIDCNLFGALHWVTVA